MICAAQAAGRAMLQLVYPEVCIFCGHEYGESDWCVEGARQAGLQWSDGAHLCRKCSSKLAPHLCLGHLPTSQTPVVAGRATGPDLVAAVGQWKYHGVRGLAWPLSHLLRPALARAENIYGSVDCVVPIPLHTSRRRARGFNQAEMVAKLATTSAMPVVPKILQRKRATGQQAKLRNEMARRENLTGAFTANLGPEAGQIGRVGLVDDLVTGGMTCEAAVSALMVAGWQVAWVACLGLALGLARPKPVENHGQVDRSAAEI